MRLCVPPLLFLALCGFTAAKTYSVTEGGNVTGQCKFHFGGIRKIFCKNTCDKKEDILAETTGDSVRNGRYSIEYSRLPDARIMHVSIALVTSADSGEYQCVMERMLSKAHRKISINVTPAPSRSTSPKQNLYFMLLLILIPVILVIVFVIYKKRKMHNDREHAQNIKTIHENIYAPEPADCTYQSLSPDTRDHNQIYCSLHKHHPSRTVNYCNC